MKKIIFVWLICFLSGVVWSQGVTLSPGSEIGDAVFRPLSIFHIGDWFLIGHAALYRNSDGSSDWDPALEDMLNSDMQHSVIQASGSGEVVGLKTFSEFLDGQKQIGKARTCLNINLGRRKIIISAAKSQYGAEYLDYPGDWRWPYVKLSKENAQSQGDTLYPEGCFRCDGLVEYCYEQVYNTNPPDPDDRGFFTQQEETHCWTKFTPSSLHGKMFIDYPHPPKIEITQPQDGDVIEDTVEIEFTTEDMPRGWGSGIDSLEILIDDVMEYSDDQDADGVKEVSHTWDASEASYGFHYITVKSYDRAGNLTEKRIKVYKGEPPIVSSTDPRNRQRDVPLEKHIKIVFSKPMDTLITQEAISADFDFTTSWSNEKTIILTPPDSLGYCTEYTVTVTDGVRDTSGTKLDGEKNSNYLPPVG